MHHFCAKQRGFTLIELAIVLVVIALLVGGVLAGQELIRASTAKKIIAEQYSIDTAVNVFQAQYNALPGDMPNATSIWGAATDWAATSSCQTYGVTAPLVLGGPTCNGNGDGHIDWGDGNSQEEQFFWHHLFNAGLINLPYPTQLGMDISVTTPLSANNAMVPGQTTPLSSIGFGAWQAVYWNKTNLTRVYGSCISPVSTFAGDCWLEPNVLEFSGAQPPWWGQAGFSPVLSPSMAFNIDSKIDDGKPDTGSVRGSSNASGLLCYVNNGGTLYYNLSNSTPQCGLAFLKEWGL